MKALVQRVTSARVEVAGEICGSIGLGVLVYLGCEMGDQEEHARKLAARVAKLRLFADAAGKTNLALAEVHGAVLLVSQFTLAADTQAGNRPSFGTALPPDLARLLVDRFARCLEEAGLPVQTGRFGAEMAVSSLNQGPATYLLEEPRRT